MNAETTTHRVIRESGLVGKFDLTFEPLADISALTKNLLSKPERSKLIELSEACERLAGEVFKAGEIPRNPAKVAMQWNSDHPGEPVPQDLIETATRGDELRAFAKKTAKAAAFAFFNEHAKPVIADIFDKAADRLADVITDRVKTEQAAFEKFAVLYHDSENIPYKPSPGLLRLLARRRQLLDKEIIVTSPPSIASSLHGIYEV